MKKFLVAFSLAILGATLSVIITDWTFASFDIAISTSILAGSFASTGLAIALYANIFYKESNLSHSLHFHPVSYFDDAIEEMTKNTPSTSQTPVTGKGMIKKGDKLSPEHRAKISASIKKRNAAKKTAQKKSGK